MASIVNGSDEKYMHTKRLYTFNINWVEYTIRNPTSFVWSHLDFVLPNIDFSNYQWIPRRILRIYFTKWNLAWINRIISECVGPTNMPRFEFDMAS